jgi:hypothetical protein
MATLNSVEGAERRIAEFLASVGGSVRTSKRKQGKAGPDIVIDADVRGKPITIIAVWGQPNYERIY